MAPSRPRAAAFVAATALTLCLPSLAAAQPVPNPDPAPSAALDARGALEQMRDLARQSEQANEAVLHAQETLDARNADLDRAQADLAAAQAQAAAADAVADQYRPEVDAVAVANYQGVRTNRLFALMVSDSPQQMIDQMAALSVIAQQTGADVDQYAKAFARASEAQAAADAARADAARASDDATRIRDDLQHAADDLGARIGDVTAQFALLTVSERANWAGSALPPGISLDDLLAGLPKGSQAGALQAAISRIGKPYVWGGNGPDQFDCSGLVAWAYRQVGKALPRSSQAQAAAGTAVARDQMQPGDVVIFYNDASHVGLYAGNGLVVHAPTFGVPVKVQALDSMPFAGARRY